MKKVSVGTVQELAEGARTLRPGDEISYHRRRPGYMIYRLNSLEQEIFLQARILEATGKYMLFTRKLNNEVEWVLRRVAIKAKITVESWHQLYVPLPIPS